MEGTLNIRNHDCRQSLQEVWAGENNQYHFVDSGLPNVYLTGIRYWVCETCKHIVKAEIPALKDLMNEIATTLVSKNSALAGREVQFLRKRLGLKAADFAKILDSTAEQLSRWENGHNEISGTMDRFIRIAYTFISGDKKLKSLAERVKTQFAQWATSIQDVGEQERIVANRVHNRKWKVETLPVAA